MIYCFSCLAKEDYLCSSYLCLSITPTAWSFAVNLQILREIGYLKCNFYLWLISVEFLCEGTWGVDLSGNVGLGLLGWENVWGRCAANLAINTYNSLQKSHGSKVSLHGTLVAQKL